MRLHPRPVIELDPITLSKPLTDLERFQKLFDQIGIKYNTQDDEEDIDKKIINVEAPFDNENGRLYIQELKVNFDKSGKFKDFYVIGD